MERFKPIPTAGLTDNDLIMRRMRLNSLGSLFYFIYVALKRRRMVAPLHTDLCRTLEREHIKDVLEVPRGHFKSTIAGEGLPMWRSLYMSAQDIDDFYKEGYSDEFVKYMKRMHDPGKHHCLVSQNITNAAKLGHKIRVHFESNPIYRGLFPETLPGTSNKWTDFSLQITDPRGSAGFSGSHGEGTFDFLGIDSAIQSRHYDGLLIQDDLVGRKSIESQSVMDKTIEYHQILPGVFDDEDKDHEADELVIGNRWSFHDLNSHLREHEPWFRFESHSALGGCCDKHPPDTPIFPEQFTFEKLMRLKERFGAYQFSAQYLNNPSAPENADFKVEWLNYFNLEYDPQGDWVVQHEVKDGIIRRDLKKHRFSIAMTVDPNHSGNAGQGRCRHAIVVVGQSDSGDYYLLDSWAQAASFDNFYQKIFEFAIKWGLHRIGVETIASQIYVAHHIEHLASSKGWSVRIDPLKGEVEGPDGTLSRKKEWRIRNIIAPIAEQQRLFIKRTQQDFISEYQTFPKGKYVDQLDAFAYAPQLLKEPIDYKTHLELLAANREGMERLGRPYSSGTSRYN
jgi:hypothetical protein